MFFVSDVRKKYKNLLPVSNYSPLETKMSIAYRFSKFLKIYPYLEVKKNSIKNI